MADVYEALGQFETSRSDWLAALGQVLEAERNLRGLLGMPAEDGFRLVPSDAPNLAPYQPDWNTALQEALTLRPELVIAREQIKASQFNLMDLKNRMLPDLRFTASYDINAIGTRMDGADPDNAFRNLASNHFNNWGMGLRLDWPLGFRDAHAGVRAARLRLAQAYWSLRLDEDKAQRFLAQQYRDVLQFQKNIEINRNATEAYNNDLNVRLERVKAGIAVLGRDQDILQTIRLGTNAMILYYDYISRYNSALAKWEYAKGTLLRRNNVVIAEGPLPCCAQVRAVEHERERSKALEIRQRAQPCLTPPVNGEVILPSLPKPEALPLPELLKSQGPLPPEVYENAKSETRNPKSPIPNPKPEAGISREKESPQLPKTAMPPGKLTLPPVSDLPPPGTETTGTISYPVNGNNNPDEETSSRRFLPQLPWNRDTKPNGSR
jgi:hypothetical protein